MSGEINCAVRERLTADRKSSISRRETISDAVELVRCELDPNTSVNHGHRSQRSRHIPTETDLLSYYFC